MTAQDLAGRRALVTGGANGIGLACVRELAARGAHVTVADLDAQETASVAAEVGGEAWTVDLSETGALEALHLDADILVNNAGLQRVAPITDYDPEQWRVMQRVMLEAPFLLIRAALPRMYERRWGRIVNVSSVHGRHASPYKAAYVAAKHGLEGLSKVAALEGASHGVTSNCVSPGYVRTPFTEKQIGDQARLHELRPDEVLDRIMLADMAIKRLIEPGEVASLVGWLVGEHASMVTGASFTMDGGWTT
ncbi:MAG: SDR family oxidoreductase [Microbacteriaceae bacterium]|jgi:3-hydroxybutyrate dehydrogenase|nr:SDR family oxidoreductase [Microbacteriaceae bacterium]HOA86578.1 SDR family oxidoreductase [Microbacteriaceae bacterium]HPZ34355.1 SDR family oxidoreductase [Microbacteriaceae bacterium]HQC93287.1 SDR family oxidoreductase [Microbacteriaceae bacterium]